MVYCDYIETIDGRNNVKIIWLVCMLTLICFSENKYTNALINEDSPYLQQHAHNPVHWYPWGEEAFEKAKREHKLIFLSIGYSTCHWCHVMEDESFTNNKVAQLLNKDYVSIKVDREEYPQIDKKYQQLFMLVYGKRGGWPLSVFMSPDAEVFHLETYIPVEEAYGLDGMLKMLPQYAKLYKEDHTIFQSLVKKNKDLMQAKNQNKHSNSQITLKVVDKFMAEISSQFDNTNGGFAKTPKFPEASKLELLLNIFRLTGNQKALYMAKLTLNKMATHGIYDQIGGGFFRYTTDAEWQMPHFEKMLYTNAELLPVYVTLYKLTHKNLYKRVVNETISQMENHFMDNNVYLSASDADSEGEEGGYFIFNYIDIKEALVKRGMLLQDVEEALAYFGIEEDGNIDGELSLAHITSERKPVKYKEVKKYLQSLLKKRTFPFVDKKINTAWNAMMIKALFCASEIDKKYLNLAQKHLKSLLKIMFKNHQLYHQVLLGKEAKQNALLEDYAFLIDALIQGYEKTYNMNYFILMKQLTKDALKNFYKNKHWYLSNDGIGAYADFDDRYYTSALSVMLNNLVNMTSLTEKLKYESIAKDTIHNNGAILKQNPSAAPKLLDTFLRLKKENIIIHASKKRLLLSQQIIYNIHYPYIITNVEKSDEYLACRTTMCFAHDKNITKLIQKINKAVK